MNSDEGHGRMRKVLVVGGAGYVGSLLVEKLIDLGHEVRVFDRLDYGLIGLRHLLSRVELIEGDLRFMSPSVVTGVDAVLNLAGISNDPTAEYDPQANYAINAIGAQHVGDVCKEHGVHRHVLASTCSVYDRQQVSIDSQPFEDETVDVSPRATYAKSKLLAEKSLLSMSGDGFCPVILRKGTVYGFSRRMRYDLVVNTFVKDALSTGSINLINGGLMWRPLLDVQDAVRTYVKCLYADADMVRGQIFNVATSNMLIRDLARQVQEILHELGHSCHIKDESKDQKVRSYRASTRKIDDTLGSRPATTLKSSIRRMIENIRGLRYDDFENPNYYNIRWLEQKSESRAAS